jgi:hypothetical protein
MLYKAQTEIKIILKVINCQMYRSGKLYSDVLNACTEKAFLGITVTNSKIPLINRKKNILRNLINNVTSKLIAAHEGK